MNKIKGLMEEQYQLGLTEEKDERHRNASIFSISSTLGHSPPKNANAAPIQNPAPFPPSNKYQIGRRGSIATIRSTGSRHSGKDIRQSITEPGPTTWKKALPLPPSKSGYAN
jgi:hypothetical protein